MYQVIKKTDLLSVSTLARKKQRQSIDWLVHELELRVWEWEKICKEMIGRPVNRYVAQLTLNEANRLIKRLKEMKPRKIREMERIGRL